MSRYFAVCLGKYTYRDTPRPQCKTVTKTVKTHHHSAFLELFIQQKARAPLRLNCRKLPPINVRYKQPLPSLDTINVRHLGGGIIWRLCVNIVRPIRRHNHGVSVCVSVCLGVSRYVTVCRGMSRCVSVNIPTVMMPFNRLLRLIVHTMPLNSR